MVEADHSIARLELGDAVANFHHRTGKLVAENLRRCDKTVMNLFDIGATDTASGYFEKQLALSDFGNRNRFNGYTAFATVDAGAHLAIDLVRSLPNRSTMPFNWRDRLAHTTFTTLQRLIWFPLEQCCSPARQRKNPKTVPAIALQWRYFCQAGSTRAEN